VLGRDGLETAVRVRLISPAVCKLMDDIGIPASLKELGVPEAALDALLEHAFNHRRQVDMNPRQPQGRNKGTVPDGLAGTLRVFGQHN